MIRQVPKRPWLKLVIVYNLAMANRNRLQVGDGQDQGAHRGYRQLGGAYETVTSFNHRRFDTWRIKLWFAGSPFFLQGLHEASQVKYMRKTVQEPTKARDARAVGLALDCTADSWKKLAVSFE